MYFPLKMQTLCYRKPVRPPLIQLIAITR